MSKKKIKEIEYPYSCIKCSEEWVAILEEGKAHDNICPYCHMGIREAVKEIYTSDGGKGVLVYIADKIRTLLKRK